MVHALETVHSLLKPGGVLVDIHPGTEKAGILAQVNGKEYFLDSVEETDDYIEYKQANEALAQVIERGLFTIEEAGQFTFLIHAATIEEMREYLTANWKDAILNESVDIKARELLTPSIERYGIFVREEILITRFKRG
jgi:2-polyprenyl-3-methyl-5-hydroxy-6-metoxy-1,4-benzoquinol methylase